jgi:SAM-dependent methyltransferase
MNMQSFLDAITTPEMQARLDQIVDERPDVRTQLIMLGPARRTEWLHTLGVAGDDDLRALAPPIPPRELRKIVAAPEAEVFLWSGASDVTYLLHLYDQFAKERPARPRVLDFGCGCGRLTRYLDRSDYEAFACDLNLDLVAWCQQNLPNVRTVRNNSAPPLPFGDASIDFAYLLSVLTHLPEAAANAWLTDLSRLLAPGGVLVVTTHGLPALETIRTSKQHREMFGLTDEFAVAELARAVAERGHVFISYRDAQAHLVGDANVGVEYGSTFVDPSYACKTFAHIFDVAEHYPGGLRGWQDVFVLRKPKAFTSAHPPPMMPPIR